MAKSADEMKATMAENLHEKTGKSLAQWVGLARKSGAAKHGEIVKFLKGEHGLTHGYANFVAHEFLAEQAPGPASEDGLVDAQYAGPKAALRPIYDALLAKVQAFGKDVEVAPKKTYVSLRRKKQFAILQASTKTRLDVGLNLPGTAATERLEDSGSFSAMCTHRVRVSEAKEIDAELLRWLKSAYQAS